ncbi:MAG: diguanylate cyclase AdrA [Marinobacter sp. T13-3]|nr:MAG: diguanylate cyclase AdrA [Marinobacter sp. T13-3]
MVLPGMNEAEAIEVADAIRDACHNTKVRVPTGEDVSFRTSIGIAVLHDQNEDRTRLLQRADEALYAAKDGGRDRYMVAPLDTEADAA